MKHMKKRDYNAENRFHDGDDDHGKHPSQKRGQRVKRPTNNPRSRQAERTALYQPNWNDDSLWEDFEEEFHQLRHRN